MEERLAGSEEVTGSNPVTFHYGRLVQWLEHRSDKAGVPGSSPGATTNIGGVAQLEERLICTQEVTGSNPVTFHYGPLAQLEERLHGMQEVIGSNPISVH